MPSRDLILNIALREVASAQRIAQISENDRKTEEKERKKDIKTAQNSQSSQNSQDSAKILPGEFWCWRVANFNNKRRFFLIRHTNLPNDVWGTGIIGK